MTDNLPITHSIIDSKSLSNLVSYNWSFPGPIHCELLNRGMNDVDVYGEFYLPGACEMVGGGGETCLSI